VFGQSTEKKMTGTVSFGANSGVVNCITHVKIYIDDKEIGIIPDVCNEIKSCSDSANLNFQIETGHHFYKAEILNNQGGIDGCLSGTTGSFFVNENECVKIFIDYYELGKKKQNTSH
jgi:hypothetical protein